LPDVDRATLPHIDRAIVDDVAANHGAADNANDTSSFVDSVFNGDGEYDAEKVAPVEANVVLVSRPGEPPPPTAAASDVPVQPGDERSLGVNDTSRLTVHSPTDDDSANNVGCQTTRALRRPRKRSSVCNNVDVEDVVLDVQSDVLTSGRKTSVSHQRHTDAAEREHRPKRKGIRSAFSLVTVHHIAPNSFRC